MYKKNNFDFLRFVFAIFVVVSHSFPLSGSHENAQWIYQFTNGQIVLASIGLNGFFVISGFFIFQSLQRSKSISNYLRKRFLRLFPGLLVLLTLTLIIVPFIYNSKIPFFSNKEFYTYLPNNLVLYGFQSGIKGVFDTNSYHSINGSLWTLRYEFSLYIALTFLFFIKNKKYLIRIILLLSFLVLFFVNNFYLERFAGSSVLGMQGYHILNFTAFFVAGSLLSSLGFNLVQNRNTPFFVYSIIFSLIILILSIYFNYYSNLKHIIFPIVILLIGYIQIPVISNFSKIGDMSYGIYIYGFPVAQTLMFFFNLTTFQLMMLSLVISILFGYYSWHLIEKKALRYKNKPFIISNKSIYNLKIFK